MTSSILKHFVIPTEAELSGGIWLQTKSKFSQNPDVSTALDMTTHYAIRTTNNGRRVMEIF